MANLLSDYELWQRSEFRAFAGGSYFNPTAELMSVGRRLVSPDMSDSYPMNIENTSGPTYAVSELFTALASQVRPEETMFGLYGRASYQLDPY